MMSSRFFIFLICICGGFFFVHSAPCTGNFFGTGCTTPCHCERLSECTRTSTSTGCTGRCESGYKGAPACQTACGGSTFGVNCATTCHCNPSMTCNRYNGQCSDGKCAPGYYSSDCQLVKPKVAAAPTITQNDCTRLTVSWNQITGTTPTIKEYKVYATTGGTATLLSTAAQIQNSATNTQSYTTQLKMKTSYTFSVTPVFTFIAANLDGVSSPQSVAVTRTCTIVAPANAKIANTNNFNLLVTWSTTQYATIIQNCQITWTLIRQGSCAQTTGAVAQTATVAFSTGSYTVNVRQAWTQYNVTLQGIDATGNTSPITFWVQYTNETTPTAAVSSLTITPSDTSAVVTWTAPTCSGQGGQIRYEVQVLHLPDNVLISDTKYAPTVLTTTISGLTVATQYSVRVQYTNSVGTSPASKKTFTTTGTAPGAPSSLTISRLGTTWAQFTWTAPTTVAAGTTYTLTVGANSYSAGSSLLYNVTSNLVQGTSYVATVAAIRNSVTQGTSPQYSFTFRSAMSGTPTMSSVTGNYSTSATSISVSWSAVTASPLPVNYAVTATYLATLLTGAAAVNSTVTASAASPATNVVVNGLTPASQYTVSVTPVYSNNVRGASTTSTAFWTAPGPMPMKPPTPASQKSTSTSITLLLKPTTYNQGPLEYYLAISPVNTAGRRKRAATVSDLGLPTGSRIIATVPAPATAGVSYTVGSGGTGNPQLSASTSYDVHWVSTSAVGPNRVTQFATTRVTTAAAPASMAWIAAIVILLIILIVLIIILVIWWRKRRLMYKDTKDQNIKLNDTSSDVKGSHIVPVYFKNWSDTERINDARFVVVDPKYGPQDLKVDSLLNRQEPHDYDSFEKEYRSLACGLEKSCNAGRLPENKAKNRNPNILPYDHCRVTLDRQGTGTTGSDYINANFVDGYLRKRAYIASQSPFDEDTVADFWLMIYQYNVQQVVMMTEMLEEATIKCTQYWPDCGQAAQYGTVYVTCLTEDEFAYYTVRSFQIVLRGTKMNAMMQTKQYQFHGWPQHGVPTTPIPLLEMYTRVKMDARLQMGPLLVHCGTGISRTAVFIALDSLLQQAVHENVVNVYKFCTKMRRCRPNMVRTARQYMFLYDLIFESLLASNQIANLDVRETFRQLSAKNPSTNHSFLWEHHCLLEKYTPSPTDTNCAVALLKENRDKNRLSSILPSDEYRVRLFSSPASADYINAVFVDGVFLQDDMILTQIPLQHTLTDFWHMIRDHRVTCIVDMQPEHRGVEGAVKWCPDIDLSIKLMGGVVIRCSDESHVKYLPGVTVREIIMEKRTVKIYGLDIGAWSDPYAKVPSDRTVLVNLVQAVRAEEDRSGPLAIVCMDGATRAGLFASCYLSAQKLSHDHFVDVFRTVKAVKTRRFQCVPHLDQYKLVFKFLWDFVRHFMSDELKSEMSTHGLLGHLPDGDLESVYSHTQYPILHTEQQGTLNSSGIHYRYANGEKA